MRQIIGNCGVIQLHRAVSNAVYKNKNKANILSGNIISDPANGKGGKEEKKEREKGAAGR